MLHFFGALFFTVSPPLLSDRLRGSNSGSNRNIGSGSVETYMDTSPGDVFELDVLIGDSGLLFKRVSLAIVI